MQISFFGEYNYDACREYEEALLDCSAKESALQVLKRHRGIIQSIWSLQQRVGALEQELTAVGDERNLYTKDKSNMQTIHDMNEKDYEKASEELGASQEKLKKYKINNTMLFMQKRLGIMISLLPMEEADRAGH